MAEEGRAATLVIDTKEPHSTFECFAARNPKFAIDTQHLELGDIQFGQLIIERKSAPDLINSIRKADSGDFWDKLLQMKEHYKYPRVWFDFTADELCEAISYSYERGMKKIRGIHNQVRGARYAIERLNIPIWERPKVGPEYILGFCASVMDRGEYVPPSGVRKRLKSIHQLRIEAIAHCQGVGYKTAKLYYEQAGQSIHTLIHMLEANGKPKVIERKMKEFFA